LTGYESFSGTSMAAPMVTGVAALGLAVHPEWGPSELRKHLKETAVDIGLPAEEQGAGRVDAANIVAVGDGPNQAPTAKMAVSTTEPDVGEMVTFDASESFDPDGEIVEYHWEDDDGDVLTGEVVEAFGPENRAYPVTLTVTDDDGATDSTTKTIYVGGKGDDPDQNEPPQAEFTITPPDPEPTQTITLDATPSSDPDGAIAEYHWKSVGGGSRTGAVIEITAPAAGSHDVSLTVTDDDGATDTVTKPISVESKAGQDDGDKQVDRAAGTLADVVDSETFSYTTSLSDPAQVVVTLEGPDDADFDLYATTDGRDPLVYDYDKRSATVNSDERIVLEDVDRGQTIGVLVDSWSGSGDFVVTIEELGT
jgi:chitodextrinase